MTATNDLAHANIEALHAWLRQGIRRMCGQESGETDAFSPHAPHIGHARDAGWMDELSDFIAVQESPLRHRLHQALNRVVDGLAADLSEATWLSLHAAIELQRLVDAEGRLPSLAAVGRSLTQPTQVLADSRRSRLLALALMAATEVSDAEFAGAKQVALPLARALIALRPPADDAQRLALRLRLARVRASEPELSELGLPPEQAGRQEEVSLKLGFRQPQRQAAAA